MHFPIRKLDGESGGGGRIKEGEEATVSRYHGMNEPVVEVRMILR